MEKNKIASLAIIVSTLTTILVLSGCLTVGAEGANNSKNFISPTPTLEMKVEDTGGTRPLTAGERLEERYQVNRQDYTIYMDKHGYNTFGALPKIPSDFGTTIYLIYTGRQTDFNKLNKDYYLQPEFYPLFVKNGLKFYETYDPRYVGTYGWGTYPSEQWVQVNAGTKGYIQFFFKTGWGIETWQGMNLKAISNCDWVTATIQKPVFLTPPTYPVFCTEASCGYDWARLITIDFEVSENAIVGQECLIGVTTIAPPKSLSQTWLDKYKTLYVAASASMVGVGTPFQGHIIVGD